MIELLRTIADISEVETTIGDIEKDTTCSTPSLLLTPVAETWKHNLLGDVRDKRIRFRMYYFMDHIVNGYDVLVEEATETLKSLITHERVKNQTTSFVNTDVRVENLEEGTVICVVADVTLEITRR